MENPIKMDDLGIPLFFENTHIDGPYPTYEKKKTPLSISFQTR